MNAHPYRGSVRREGVSVNHRDLGRLPLLGREESLTVAGDQVSRDALTGGQPCASCGRVMLKTEDFYAVCVCCGLPICSGKECRVFCLEETCRQAVCPRDRRKIGETEQGQPDFLCLPHYEEHSRQVAIVTALVIGAMAILGTVLFFIFR